MVSPSSLKPSAPSINLLRFLRSQSESLCFFTLHLGSQAKSNADAVAASRQYPWTPQSKSGISWSHCESVRCPVAAEASLIPFFRSRPKKSNCFSRPAVASSQYLIGGPKNEG